MMLFVSGTTKSLAREIAKSPTGTFGFLTSPAAGNSIAAITSLGVPWAIDNGAFSGFDSLAFELLITRAAYASRKPEWVVCPDVVGDAKGTLKMFREWQWKIAGRGLPVAFVAQDGQEDLSIPPWPLFSCLFVGGSTEWKLSKTAEDLVIVAKRHGKTVHMGRVNSRRRLRFAIDIGCDSCDGTGMSRWGDVHLHKFARWTREIIDNGSLTKTQ